MTRRTIASRTALVAAVLLAAGCGGRSGTSSIPATSVLRSAAHRSAGSSKIQHVIIMMQENRSFDNVFHGFKGADYANYGMNSKGEKIKLQPVSLVAAYSIDHTSGAYFTACDGTGSIPGTNCQMDHFDLEGAAGMGMPHNPQYAYIPNSETGPYFDIAHQYVLGDRMFTSHIDASFVSHQYSIAAQAQSAVDLPLGTWGCGGGKHDTIGILNPDRTYGPTESPCFNYPTLADELDAAGLSWRAYAASGNGWPWMAYQAVKHIVKSPEYQTNIITPPSQFLTDVANGQLAAVTWITPTCADSDHPDCLSKTGPAWIASVINAVGESQFWDTTTIFVFWDEWGGWYDHVPPPYVDYDGLGIRVPLLIVSPYAKKNYVSHVQYEHGSILKYAENVFGLAPLAASDSRANDPADDAFDYSRKPRKFTPIASQLGPSYFIHEPPDPRPIDEQ